MPKIGSKMAIFWPKMRVTRCLPEATWGAITKQIAALNRVCMIVFGSVLCLYYWRQVARCLEASFAKKWHFGPIFEAIFRHFWRFGPCLLLLDALFSVFNLVYPFAKCCNLSGWFSVKDPWEVPWGSLSKAALCIQVSHNPPFWGSFARSHLLGSIQELSLCFSEWGQKSAPI